MQYTFLLLDLVQGVTLNVQNKIGQNRTTGSTLICIIQYGRRRVLFGQISPKRCILDPTNVLLSDRKVTTRNQNVYMTSRQP